MVDLVEMVRYQDWSHLLAPLISDHHEKEVREFYHEMTFIAGGLELSTKCASKIFLSFVGKVENLDVERLFKKQMEEYECVRRKGGLLDQKKVEIAHLKGALQQTSTILVEGPGPMAALRQENEELKVKILPLQVGSLKAIAATQKSADKDGLYCR
ncbi:hypothetical protein HAX54_021098 [Datura stramonium]|uniref:Uncharacterized protein n=1 Tax=Datura stramonium TaxID=4076 RepID=A0ABS8UU39_DATST|nr:hypothetical protein [Datura stramonium]